MDGQKNIEVLIRDMSPTLSERVYVFCHQPSGSLLEVLQSWSELDPIGAFREEEGITVILPLAHAKEHRLAFQFPSRMITLNIHSDLAAVGFLARVTTELAQHGISVNPVSATFHDHLFVPETDAQKAVELLKALSARS